MKLKIVTVPNPLLQEKSKKISRIDDSIRQLALDMAETVEAYGSEHEVGAALAAIQVGVPLRMTIIRDEETESYFALINPEIVKVSKETLDDLEGCISVPKKYGTVTRPKKIKVKGLDINGKKIEIKAEGMMARVLCHEIDHMDGKLFLDYIQPGTLCRLTSDGKLVKIKD